MTRGGGGGSGGGKQPRNTKEEKFAPHWVWQSWYRLLMYVMGKRHAHCCL
ncbi:unnamed protein product [Ectocarpus sp. CCAP 1310/34]|nr:unnamed protein product [Ectocarpus sp. CCAP 1310/34]